MLVREQLRITNDYQTNFGLYAWVTLGIVGLPFIAGLLIHHGDLHLKSTLNEISIATLVALILNFYEVGKCHFALRYRPKVHNLVAMNIILLGLVIAFMSFISGLKEYVSSGLLSHSDNMEEKLTALELIGCISCALIALAIAILIGMGLNTMAENSLIEVEEDFDIYDKREHELKEKKSLVKPKKQAAQ